jgi:cytochrome c-type biogenesis protein CcmH
MKALAVVAAVALAFVPGGLASEQHPTLNELENEVMCPVCNTTLAQSSSDAARQIERVIQGRIRAGWTKTQIKDFLVQQYGESILASPPAHGFNLLAWVLPLAGIVVAASVLGVAAWRWSRDPPDRRPAETGAELAANGRGRLDSELERRVDEELARFD